MNASVARRRRAEDGVKRRVAAAAARRRIGDLRRRRDLQRRDGRRLVARHTGAQKPRHRDRRDDADDRDDDQQLDKGETLLAFCLSCFSRSPKKVEFTLPSHGRGRSPGRLRTWTILEPPRWPPIKQPGYQPQAELENVCNLLILLRFQPGSPRLKLLRLARIAIRSAGDLTLLTAPRPAWPGAAGSKMAIGHRSSAIESAIADRPWIGCRLCSTALR